MTELERIRHSAAHVMATAILRLWPDAQFAAGPPVENGFYYDVELDASHLAGGFPEHRGRDEKGDQGEPYVSRKSSSRANRPLKDAESGRLGGLTERPGNPSKFKIGNLEAIPEGEPISYFKNGDFIDLCAGPHVMRTGNIGAFKLTTWPARITRATRSNPQLQRIYGTAFKNKTELDAYFKMLEEAKRRDHRKIGAEMGLFAIDTEYVGPGLPLWLPKGTAHRRGTGKAGEGNGIRRRLRARENAAHRQGENVSDQRPFAVLYAESMFPPMRLRSKESMTKLANDEATRSRECCKLTT